MKVLVRDGMLRSVMTGMQTTGSSIEDAALRRSSQFARWAWTAPSLLYLLLLYVLPAPAALSDGTDQSYQAILVELFLRGAQFGRDVIFTFGPWGFLLQPRGNPQIYPWVVFGRSVLAFGTFVGAVTFATRLLRSAWMRGIWLFAFVVVGDPVFLLPFLLFVIAAQDRHRSFDWRYVVLVLACGLAACVKFTSLILVTALVFFLLIDGIVRTPKSFWIALGLPVSFVAFFLAAKQQPGMIGDYLIGSLSVTSGFTAAMGVPGSLAELALGLLLCVLVPAAYVLRLARDGQWRLLPLAVWLFAYFFLGFKQGFVRSDPYHLYSGLVYMVLPACFAIVAEMYARNCIPDGSRRSLWFPQSSEMWLALLLTAGGGMLALRYLQVSSVLPQVRERIERLPLSLSAERREETYRREIEQLRTVYPLGPIEGTGDLIGYSLFLLPVWGMTPRTAPALQTYAAYDAYLTKRDAEFYSGPNAPEHVLVGVEPLDLHFPAVEDSLAWLALRANYVPDGYSGKYLHLRRGRQPVTLNKLRLVEQKLRFGERMALPTESPLWAEVDISENLLGKIAGLLLKVPAIKMDLEGASWRREYRLLPETARVGFLLSPAIDRPADFESLFGTERPVDQLPRAISFRVSPAGGERLESPEIAVRIYRLVMQP